MGVSLLEDEIEMKHLLGCWTDPTADANEDEDMLVGYAPEALFLYLGPF